MSNSPSKFQSSDEEEDIENQNKEINDADSVK
jgi:hypothetical protein